MYRLKACGRVETKCAADIKTSRLGIGFEKLDRDAFEPEKAYDKLANIGVKWVRIQSGWQKTERVKGCFKINIFCVFEFAVLINRMNHNFIRGIF